MPQDGQRKRGGRTPAWIAGLAFTACTQAPVTPPPIDGGALHSYTCPVSDGGPAWSCQDGLTTPVGTCAQYGCRPLDVTTVTVTRP